MVDNLMVRAKKHPPPPRSIVIGLRKFTVIENTLGKERLERSGFDASEWPIAKKAAILNKTQEMLSTSDIANAENIELQDMTKKATRITEDLITNTNNIQSQKDKSIEV